jgi:hypothetical protein
MVHIAGSKMEGKYMARDSASIAFESAGLLGQAFPPDDESGFGFGEVFIGQIGNGGDVSLLEPLLPWIDASFDLAEKAPSLAARLFRGQAAIIADRKPSRSALAITVLTGGKQQNGIDGNRRQVLKFDSG